MKHTTSCLLVLFILILGVCDATAGQPTVDASGNYIINVMAVFTPAAALKTDNIHSYIAYAVDSANISFILSGVAIRFNLVHTAQVDLVESGNDAQDLYCIGKKGDGCHEEVQQWRDQYGADLVSFWFNGYSNESMSLNAAALKTGNPFFYGEAGGFASINTKYGITVSTNDIYAHEHGHNLGANHDRGASVLFASSLPYAYGYVSVNNGWKCLMAYSTACPSCMTLPLWSNPDVSLGGQPIGIPAGRTDSADNRRAINTNAPEVSAYRDNVSTSSYLIPTSDGSPDSANNAIANSTQMKNLFSWVAVVPFPTAALQRQKYYVLDLSGIPLSPPTGRADFNGDGRADILWRNKTTGENYLWFMNGVSKFSAASPKSLVDTNWTATGVGDFNGDGKPDIIWRNKVTGQNAVWYMDGATKASAEYLQTIVDLNWSITGVGDFDLNGTSDILLNNSATGQNRVWYMSGATKTRAEDLPPVVDKNWVMVGVGDFNSDSKPDILWSHRSSGQNYVWYMDGAKRTGGDYLPSIANLTWEVVGVDDFNFDSKPDVLWRNKSTGQNYLWYMNGAARTRGEYIDTWSDTNWKIVNR